MRRQLYNKAFFGFLFAIYMQTLELFSACTEREDFFPATLLTFLVKT